MTRKLFPSDIAFREALQTHYAMDTVALTRLDLGADRDAAVYRAETSDKLSYFVKLKRGSDADISAHLLAFLGEEGGGAIIPPFQTRDGQSTVFLGGCILTVFPFMEGEDGFQRELTEAEWVGFGHVMGQIHALQLPPSLQENLRRESFSPQWRQAVRELYSLIGSEPEGNKGDRIAKDFHGFLKKQQDVIQCLLQGAERLAGEVQKEAHPFVLCHGDLHGGNVLIDQKGNLYIVDWDHPILAPRERDLMFMGGGVGGVWNKPYENELFYEGYGNVDVNRTLLAYYRHERILEDLVEYAQLLLLSKAGGHERVEWYHQIIAQFEPQGVVEIALRTAQD